MSESRYKKRIYKELESAHQLSNLHIYYDMSNSTFQIKCKYDKKYEIYFELNGDYPFKPPSKVMINNYIYNHDLWSISSSVYNKLFFHYKKCCLSCNSIMCSNNWKPGYTLVSIVNEIISNQNLLKAIYGINMLCYNNIYIPSNVEKKILSFIA